MIRFFTLRSFFSLALLLLGAAALVAGIKTSVDDVGDAAFLPVAFFATIVAYIMGFGYWSARRVIFFLLPLGFLFILLQVSRTAGPVWEMFLRIPVLEFNALIAWLTQRPLDTSFFQIRLNEIFNKMEIFLMGILPGSGPRLVLRELLWDLPLLLVCAWAGWWTSRRDSILVALAPMLALLAFILNYTEKRTLTLQIAVFAFIFLMGIYQKWSLPKSAAEARINPAQGKVRRETYATIFVLAFVLTIAAGWAPIFAPEQAKPQAAEQSETDKALGLEKQVVETIKNVSSSGLPREHLITSAPENLMTVVFLANTGQAPILDGAASNLIIPHYYWRWLSYDVYNGKGWSTSPVTNKSYAADESLFQFSGEGYTIVHQNITKASETDDHFYWTGTLIRSSKPFDVTWRVQPPQQDALLHMDMLGSLIDTQQYSADSLVPQFSETQLRSASQEYPPQILQNYLALPDTISQRVRDLAASLTAQPQNSYDKAKAIEAYLRTFPYTLEVPPFPADKEIADYFLFELQKGYCDYYATSMVVLARAAGLPARLVIGYSSGEYDPATAQYIVREANAHSWAEVYFPGIGWVEFEPTSSQPQVERPVESAEEELSIEPLPTQKDRSDIIRAKGGHFVQKPPYLAIFLLILVILGVCWWYLRTQGLLLSYTTIASIYAFIYYHGRKIHRNGSLNETPSLFSEKLKAKLKINHSFLQPAPGELDQLTRLYLQEIYSPRPITMYERAEAVQIWRRLLWRLLYARVMVR
jgi:transglutaminase-like putative cysteine protease